MSNEEAKQRAKNYMSLKGALEPKQIKCYCGHTTMCDCIPLDELTQETLEKAAERFYPIAKGGSMWMPSADDCNKANKQEGFIQGAKWQQERSYSEEEVRNLFRNYQYDLAQWVLRMEDDIDGKPIPTDWFEQFKKK